MKDIAASVRARLLNVAKAQGVDFNQVLVRFALERWNAGAHPLSPLPVRARGSLSAQGCAAVHPMVCHAASGHARCRLAGLRCERSGIGGPDLSRHRQRCRGRGRRVRSGLGRRRRNSQGCRIRRGAHPHRWRAGQGTCKTQIDVGFGDAVTPAPVDSIYPVLLDDLRAPRLRTYPVYTVIAEKLHAIAPLGMTNSRMKDDLDLSVLLVRESPDIGVLVQAVKATFERRGMALPATLPVGMTDEFAHDTSRQTLWQAFLKKNELAPESLAAVVVRLRAALEPALNRAAKSSLK